MMNVKQVDVAMYTAFRHLVDSGRMPRNELYYAILDWADQNQDVVNEYIKNTECYVVKCLTAKTIEEKKFTIETTKTHTWPQKDFSMKQKTNATLLTCGESARF